MNQFALVGLFQPRNRISFFFKSSDLSGRIFDLPPGYVLKKKDEEKKEDDDVDWALKLVEEIEEEVRYCMCVVSSKIKKEPFEPKQ
jgi:hypothetical protein